MDAVKRGEIKANLKLVVSDNPNAYGLKRAESDGLKTLIVKPKDFTNRQSVDRQLVIELKEEKIDFIVLAGYRRLLTPFFVKQFPRKIINIHPSLLPSFKGLKGIKDAFTYGVKVTGATVHFVDAKMDHGPIILQESCHITEKDTLTTLEKKIHKIEHRIFPKAIALFVEGKLNALGRRVQVTGLAE